MTGKREIKRQWMQAPAELLRSKRPDAVTLLRLGAFANAVQALTQRLVSLSDDEPGAERDRMHLFVASVGYMKEAVDHIQLHQARLRELMNVARTHGYPLIKWSEMAPLVTTGTPAPPYPPERSRQRCGGRRGGGGRERRRAGDDGGEVSPRVRRPSPRCCSPVAVPTGERGGTGRSQRGLPRLQLSGAGRRAESALGPGRVPQYRWAAVGSLICIDPDPVRPSD